VPNRVLTLLRRLKSTMVQIRLKSWPGAQPTGSERRRESTEKCQPRFTSRLHSRSAILSGCSRAALMHDCEHALFRRGQSQASANAKGHCSFSASTKQSSGTHLPRLSCNPLTFGFQSGRGSILTTGCSAVAGQPSMFSRHGRAFKIVARFQPLSTPTSSMSGTLLFWTSRLPPKLHCIL